MIPLKKQNTNSVLALSIEDSHLEGFVLRRTGGSIQAASSVSATLALNILTASAELMGREIRNHLEKAEIRERRCIVCLPLSWALTLQSKLPPLPEADIQSFLQIEAERGFPYGPETLMISESRFRAPSGDQYATLIAVPRDHVQRMEAALRAARLVPVSFSFGLPAMVSSVRSALDGSLAISITPSSVGLQVSSGGGIVALRTLNNAVESEGAERKIYADVVARELRITLGDLPDELRGGVRRALVMGEGELTERFVSEARARVEAMGLKLERVTRPAQMEIGAALPDSAPMTPALCLGARLLAGNPPTLEFLPPKVSAWKQFNDKYASKKLAYGGMILGVIALLIALAFIYQQVQLSSLRSEWARMAPKVRELEEIQQNIRSYRPWFDDSFRTLSMMKRLTEAFPEDGSVTAKSVEFREGVPITCSGTARDSESLRKTLEKLRTAEGISDVQEDQRRGSSPIQFTFNFQWQK